MKFKLEKERCVPTQTQFGGSLLKTGKRKTKRPIDFSKPLHLVLRTDRRYSPCLVKEQLWVEYYVNKFAANFKIRIYNQAVVSNHIHLLGFIQDRKSYSAFVRAVTGSLTKRLGCQWQVRPFSRVVSWGKDFRGTSGYVLQNQLEAFKVIPYKQR